MSADKKEKSAIVFPMVLMGGLFVIIHLLSLLIVKPFEDIGLDAFDNPNDPTNLIFVFVSLLAITGTILLIAKFWKKQLIHVFILGSIAYTSFFVISPLLSYITPFPVSLLLSLAAVSAAFIMPVHGISASS